MKILHTLLFLAVSSLLMTLPATDPFTGSAGSPVSANWTAQQGHIWTIQAGGVDAGPAGLDIGTYTSMYWSADVFNNDQYSEGVISSLGGNVQMGPAVRMTSGSTTNGYWLFIPQSGSDTKVFSMVSGSYTQLADFGVIAWAVSDTAHLEVSGTTITAKRNGSSIGTATSTDHASGSAGVVGLDGNSPNVSFSSWTGGNVGAAPPASNCRKLLLWLGCEPIDSFVKH